MKGYRDKTQDRSLKTWWLCEKMTSWKSLLHQERELELDKPPLPSSASPGILSLPSPSPASKPDSGRLPRAGVITLKFSDKGFADGDYSFFLSSLLFHFSSTFCFWDHRVDSDGRVYKAKIVWAVSQARVFHRIKWLGGKMRGWNNLRPQGADGCSQFRSVTPPQPVCVPGGDRECWVWDVAPDRPPHPVGVVVVVWSLSRGQLFDIPWTVGLQAPTSMWFPRQEYWSGLPFPTPGDLPNTGFEPASPAWQADTLPLTVGRWEAPHTWALHFLKAKNKKMGPMLNWLHALPSSETLFKKYLKCIHIAAIPHPLHSHKLCFPCSDLLSTFPCLTLSQDNGLASSYVPKIKGIRQNSLNSLLQNSQDLSSHHFCNLMEPSLPCPPPASYL